MTPHAKPASGQENAPCPSSEAGGLNLGRLAGVLRAARHIAIISTDLQGIIQVFNTGAELMLGYGAEELIGKARPDILHLPSEVDAYASQLSQRLGSPVIGGEACVALVRQGGPQTQEAREWTYVRKDGSRFPAFVTITGVYGGAGLLEGFLAVAQDLSQRKILEAELRQARVSMDHAGDMIFWSSPVDARLKYANQTACDLLGYTQEELLRLSVLDLNPARTLENWQAHCQDLRIRGRSTSEMTFLRKDGTRLPVETAASMAELDGQEYAVGIVRDISLRKALEARLRQAQVSMDSAGDMIFWYAAEEGKVIYANQAACDILGYTRQELLEMTVLDLNPARTLENWAAHCEALRSQGRITLEMTFRRKDGGLLPVEASSSLVVEDGQDYVLGIVRDITVRRADEERLRFETRLNQSLAEAARALIGTAPDMNAIAGLLLDRACELTGSRHGYVGFVDQASGGLQPRAMTAMMKTGECTLGALPVTFPPNPDGRYRGLWGLSLNTRQGFFENAPDRHPEAVGLPEGHVGISQLLAVPAVAKGRLVGQIALANPGRDYTRQDLDTVAALADVFALGVEQSLAQKAIMAAKEEAEASSRAKSEFLANMTHEVRTPLNGMLGMLQVLLGTGLSAEQTDYATVALESAERLNLLLNNVIDYARLDAAKAEENRQSFPPTDLLHALAALYEPQARAKGLDFRSQAEPGLPELVLADAQALQRALAKLLDNAIKFTMEGGVLLSAGLAPDRPDLLVFRVEDTGIGIPPEKRAQVFEAFVQADASITRTFGGAGLGLAIARKLAARLGGEVEARDREGGGTVMILTVPVELVAATGR